MSYRTIKRILGETSLERKCRFLFGSGLMVLIAGSFWFYAHLNSRLVLGQNESAAQLLVKPALMEKHWRYFESDKDFAQLIQPLTEEFTPSDVPEFSRMTFSADPAHPKPELRPDYPDGMDALTAFKNGETRYTLIADNKYHYYAGITAAQGCVKCHKLYQPKLKEGDLLGMVKITIPMKSTMDAQAANNAILLTTAIVTTFLAMLAAYAIVRYVIVKPVLHLKNVSDEIAKGHLDLRADIRTGDEFEELSHAFNRMLRHLVTVQNELREVNSDLDSKVDELAQVNLTLYKTNQLKDEFLATMSHELRTPMNSILGFSDVLSGSDNLTTKQSHYLKNIQNSGKELLVLINDLLDLSKIESGKLEITPTEFSLSDLISLQVNSLEPLAQKKNIEITFNVHPELNQVFQDRSKLQQILNNLLSNAIKFTPEGGRVRISVRAADGENRLLIVEDSGIGIPLEDQEAIFEKFRQGKVLPGQANMMTREYGGTGLGLSIVKELVKLLGGEIFLESEFGKGSTFSVRFPVHLDRELLHLDQQMQERLLGIEEMKLPVKSNGKSKRDETDSLSSGAERSEGGNVDSAADSSRVPT